MTIGERIRKLRQENHITQLELAKKLDVPYHYIHPYEYDQRVIPMATVAALAHALNTTSEYLLGITEQPEGLFESVVEDEHAIKITRHDLYTLWHLTGVIEGLVVQGGQAGIADDLTFVSDQLTNILVRIDPDPNEERKT